MSPFDLLVARAKHTLEKEIMLCDDISRSIAPKLSWASEVRVSNIYDRLVITCEDSVSCDSVCCYLDAFLHFHKFSKSVSRDQFCHCLLEYGEEVDRCRR